MSLMKLGLSVNNIEMEIEDEEGGEPTIFPTIPGEKVKFSIDHSVPPTKNAYYNIPAAFSERAAARVKEMEKKGIIERVTKAPRWISGMTAVPKGANDFRLVVNMRGPNRAINRSYYRLPHLDEIQKKLHGATKFTKLDLRSAFHHAELDEESRELTTFMAEDGMYRFMRLLFGVVCAPEAFQEIMERILRGIDGVIIYIDDILIFGATERELAEREHAVLKALKENNLTLNDEKCEYRKDSLSFLGHRISAQGMNVDEVKVKAILDMRPPKSLTELRSFLGLVNFIGSYLPWFSDLTKVLWELTTKENFEWTEEAQQSFDEVKQKVAYETITKGFLSETDETILYTDASPDSLGATLV